MLLCYAMNLLDIYIYLLICFRFRFGTEAIFFLSQNRISFCTYHIRRGDQTMPPTSDGIVHTQMASEAVVVSREQGNQNWCLRRAPHVKIGGMVTGSQAS